MGPERLQHDSRPPLLQTAVGRWLCLAAASVVLVGAALLGAFLLIALLGMGIVAGTIIAGRLWWAKRKLARDSTSGHAAQERRIEVIEGEYSVVRERTREE